MISINARGRTEGGGGLKFGVKLPLGACYVLTNFGPNRFTNKNFFPIKTFSPALARAFSP